MAYDIGPVIGIEGEKEFRQAIQQINTNMKTLGTEMMAVSSNFDKGDKSVEAFTSKNEVLNKQIDAQKQKLSELQKGLQSSAEKYGENDKVTQGWQQAVNKATADLNNMEREIRTNTQAMDDYGEETDDATEKTGKFGSGLKAIGGSVAKGAVTAVAAVGAAFIGAAAGALKLASDVGKTADDLITMSNKTGISTKQLQEMQYASRFVDVEVETMTGSMIKLTKSMDTARSGSKDSSAAFKSLGISVTDQNGNLRDAHTVWLEAIGALGKMPNETERNALAMKLFGKSAAELNPLIAAGADELSRLGEEANKVGAVLSDEALAAAGKFDDAMQTLDASMKGLVGSLGVAVLPAVQEVVNQIVAVVPEVTNAIRSGDWQGAGQAISDGLNDLLSDVAESLPGIAVMAASVVNGLVDTILENAPSVFEAGLGMVNVLLEGILDSIPQLADASIEIVLAIVNGLTDLLPDIVTAALEIVIALANGLIDALPEIIEKVPEIVNTIVDVIIENLPLIIDAAIQIVIALAVALIENLPLIITSVISIVGAIFKALINGIIQIVAFAPKLFASLIGEFSNIKWGELGGNIIKGIVSGVASAAKSLASSVVDAAKGALESTKDFLGIESPSTVMRDQVGKMIGLGMAEGISNSARAVNAAMAGLNSQIVEDSSPGSSPTASSTASVTTGAGESGETELTLNLVQNLDGSVLSSTTSKIQVTKNYIKVRSKGGLVPA